MRWVAMVRANRQLRQTREIYVSCCNNTPSEAVVINTNPLTKAIFNCLLKESRVQSHRASSLNEANRAVGLSSGRILGEHDLDGPAFAMLATVTSSAPNHRLAGLLNLFMIRCLAARTASECARASFS